MSRHMISRASQLFFGAAQKNTANGGKAGVPLSGIYVQNFGAPAAAAANNICASQSVTVGTTPLAVINGALAAAGVATADLARNVVAAWTGTAVLTVTGTGRWGGTIVESSASGTSFTGKKAFKTITSVSLSANVTGLTVGTGDVLGLDYRVDANGLLFARANNAIDAGTFVPAVTTSPATATTGDVRGTFDPAVALNGSNTCQVGYVIADASSRIGGFGVENFSG